MGRTPLEKTKNGKYVKANIYKKSAEQIDVFLKDSDLCYELNINNRSDFVKLAVKEKIDQIKEKYSINTKKKQLENNN